MVRDRTEKILVVIPKSKVYLQKILTINEIYYVSSACLKIELKPKCVISRYFRDWEFDIIPMQNMKEYHAGK